MIPALLAVLAPVIGKVLEKIPNPGEREKLRMELEAQIQAQEMELIKVIAQSDVAQAEINKIEAASTDKFKAYPRPLAMWIAVAGLAWNIIPVMVGQFFVWFGYPAPAIVQLPEFVVDTLLYGLLGLGAYRTAEKFRNK